MSDTEETRDEEMLEPEPESAENDLVIVPGASEGDADDAALLVPAGPEDDEEPTPDAAAAPEAAASPQFKLDALVAEMADVPAVTAEAPAATAAVDVAAPRVDALAAFEIQAPDEANPLEAALWTRVPFWVLTAVWLAGAGALTYLLWPLAKPGLEASPLYSLLVYGGAGMVFISAVAGLVVWSRARSVAGITERGVVGRAVMVRALAWTAAGVALWVIAMIVLSFHSLKIIP